MEQPSLLVCDSDALIQLECTRLVRQLAVLSSQYGIQPVVVTEVRNELAKTQKFGQQLQLNFQKAYKNGLLRILDDAFLRERYGPPAAALSTQINSLGLDYYLRVDRGEAYTLAAAVVLGQPALSNDYNALRVLEHHGKVLPSSVLRVLDLICFLYQSEALTLSAAEDALQALKKYGEAVPGQFKNRSFENRFIDFDPRLLDSTRPPIGQDNRVTKAYGQVLRVSPLTPPASAGGQT